VTTEHALLRVEATILRKRAATLSEENAQLQAELRTYKELAASLTDRLTVAQADNETAYKEAYNAVAGPHFCPGQSFGARPRPGIRDLAQGDAS
jgi:hypothetical protein